MAMEWGNSGSGWGDSGGDAGLRALVESLSTQLHESELKIAELESEQREMSKVLARAVSALLERQVLTEADAPWLSGWLSRGAQAPGVDLRRSASRAAHRVVAKVRCTCGAMVDAIAGGGELQCPWCGKAIGAAAEPQQPQRRGRT